MNTEELTKTEIQENTNALINDFKADAGVEAKNISDLIRANIAGSKSDILWEILSYARELDYEDKTYNIDKVVDNLIFEIGLGMDARKEEKRRYIEYVLSNELPGDFDYYIDEEIVVVYNKLAEHFSQTRIIALFQNMWSVNTIMRVREGKTELAIY